MTENTWLQEGMGGRIQIMYIDYIFTYFAIFFFEDMDIFGS